MGFFSVLKNVVTTILPVLDPVLNKNKRNLEGAFNTTAGGQLQTIIQPKTSVMGKVSTGLAVGLAVTNPIATLNILKSVGKFAWNSPGKATIIGGVATLGAGYIASNPFGAVKDASSVVTNVFEAGADLRDLKDNPTKDNIIAYVGAHPFATAGALATFLATLGISAFLVSSIVKNFFPSRKDDVDVEVNIPPTKENGKDSEKALDTSAPEQPKTPKEQTDDGITARPIAPETTSVTTGQKRRRYKAKKVVTPSIRQNVFVQVSSRSVGVTNKRYINTPLLVGR